MPRHRQRPPRRPFVPVAYDPPPRRREREVRLHVRVQHVHEVRADLIEQLAPRLELAHLAWPRRVLDTCFGVEVDLLAVVRHVIDNVAHLDAAALHHLAAELAQAHEAGVALPGAGGEKTVAHAAAGRIRAAREMSRRHSPPRPGGRGSGRAADQEEAPRAPRYAKILLAPRASPMTRVSTNELAINRFERPRDRPVRVVLAELRHVAD